jgi:hypothetical protein
MKTSIIGRIMQIRHYPMSSPYANWYMVLTVVVVLLFSWQGLLIWLGLSLVVAATFLLLRWRTGHP